MSHNKLINKDHALINFDYSIIFVPVSIREHRTNWRGIKVFIQPVKPDERSQFGVGSTLKNKTWIVQAEI